MRPHFFAGFAMLALVLLSSPKAYSEDWIYSVKQGETLWGLCLEYTNKRDCWQTVGPYNGVVFPRSLAPGTRIKFPVEWLKAQPVSARLIHLSGNVEIQHLTQEQNSAAVAAQEGALLNIGSVVRTSERSNATIQFADESLMVIESNSEVRFDTLSRHGENGMVDTNLNLMRGAVTSKVKKREPASRYSVQTPSAIAAVRGTDFKISADATTMRGQVFEGSVGVGRQNASNSAHQEKAVVAGYGIVAQKDKALPEPTKLLDAPIIEAHGELLSFPYALNWAPIEGAQQYHVNIFSDNENSQLVLNENSLGNQFEIPQTLSGCFRTEISAIDSMQLQGMPASTKFCGAAAPEQPTLVGDATRLRMEEGLVQWDASPRAIAYEVQQSKHKDFSVIESTHATELTEFTLPESDSKVYLRVRAIGEFSTASEFSDTLEIKKDENKFLTGLGLFLLGVAVLL